VLVSAIFVFFAVKIFLELEDSPLLQKIIPKKRIPKNACAAADGSLYSPLFLKRLIYATTQRH
jgi:hypothetical protein